MAFVGVTVLTLGLAEVIVPASGAATPGGQPAEPSGSGVGLVPEPTDGGIPGLGGTLTVSGDRQGTLRLTDDSVEGRYSLIGNDGRVSFSGQPVEVVQVSYDGLEFFPDPGDCAITPGNLDGLIGLGTAELRCDRLTDVRGNGVIGLAGTLGLPIDLLGERTHPPSGGSLAVGDETWTFPEAILLTWNQAAIAGNSDANMLLVDESRGAGLAFRYDIETHQLSLDQVLAAETESPVPDGACSLRRTELGKTNPRTVVAEVRVDCPAVEVPGLGTVPISGTLVVDELQWPES